MQTWITLWTEDERPPEVPEAADREPLSWSLDWKAGLKNFTLQRTNPVHAGAHTIESPDCGQHPERRYDVSLWRWEDPGTMPAEVRYQVRGTDHWVRKGVAAGRESEVYEAIGREAVELKVVAVRGGPTKLSRRNKLGNPVGGNGGLVGKLEAARESHEAQPSIKVQLEAGGKLFGQGV